MFTFGPIYNSQNKKTREWSISVSLFDKKDKEIVKQDDRQLVDEVEIKDGYYASYTTTSGYTGMKMTVSAPTLVRTGKNLGKKNATNVLTQAFKECQSKFTSKLKAGYVEERPTSADTSQETGKVPFPMAVQMWKNMSHKLTYPVFIQPKLDGVRMLAQYDNGEVKMWTRRLHEIAGFEEIKEALKEMFESSGLETFFVDGELYSHGTNLQTISGIVRNTSIPESEKKKLKFHVFDCFDVNQADMVFSDRLRTLRKLVKAAKSSAIVPTKTVSVKTAAEADAFFADMVEHGYEGVVYKSADRKYEFDFNKEKRSAFYLKRKKQDDAEFTIIGFTEGKGKDIDCIVFVLETAGKKEFNCVPNGTYEYRKELYQQALKAFDKDFKGKLAKVVYDDLSKDGVPLRGRIVQIGRDLNID